MKRTCLIALFLLVVSGPAFADPAVQYKLFKDGHFSVEYPDWRERKPGNRNQIWKVSIARSSVLIDAYDADIDFVYDQTLRALEKEKNLIQADRDRYTLEYKISLLLFKIFIKKKFVYANDKTYVVSFVALGKQYKKKKEIADHVFASIKPSNDLASDPLRSTEKTALQLQKDEFQYGLYRVKIDGSGLKRIYGSDLPIRDPEVSPDGKKILFYQMTKDSNGDGKIYDGDWDSTEIAVVNLDGSGFKFLTRNRYWDIQPNWTSDGKHIVFVSNRDQSRRFDLDLFVMDVGTGEVKNITNTKNLLEADPDCRAGKVVMTRFDQDRVSQSIWIMNEDGSNQKRITSPPKSGKSKTGNRFGDFDPNLTEDGKRITFVRLEDDGFRIEGKVVGNYDLYVMDVNGTHLKNISNTPFLEGVPAWSPDGKYISFTVVGQGIRDRYKISVCDPDGEGKRRVLKRPPTDFLAREVNWFPAVPGEIPELIFAGEWYK